MLIAGPFSVQQFLCLVSSALPPAAGVRPRSVGAGRRQAAATTRGDAARPSPESHSPASFALDRAADPERGIDVDDPDDDRRHRRQGMDQGGEPLLLDRRVG